MNEKVYELPKVRCKIVMDGSLRTAEPLDNYEKLSKAIREYIKDFDVEHMIVVNLTAKMKPISIREIGVGSINTCIAYMPSIFKTAIIENAASVMIVHNHPSGETDPSEQDLELTKKAVKAGDLLDIEMLEHLIIAGDSCYSIRDSYPEIFKPRRWWE